MLGSGVRGVISEQSKRREAVFPSVRLAYHRISTVMIPRETRASVVRSVLKGGAGGGRCQGYIEKRSSTRRQPPRPSVTVGTGGTGLASSSRGLPMMVIERTAGLL